MHEKGGKNPSWEQTFDFNVATEKELILEILDKENKGKDRFMGMAKVCNGQHFLFYSLNRCQLPHG